MKKLLVTLSLLVANTAMANVSECLPTTNYGAPNEIAAKAFVNSDANTITVILKDGRSVSGELVKVENYGPTARGLSEADAQASGITATVAVGGTKMMVIVSQYMSMGMGQQLLCK